jgi:hypothetical protein
MAKEKESVPNTPSPKTPLVDRGKIIEHGGNSRLPNHPSPPPPPPPKIDDKR